MSLELDLLEFNKLPFWGDSGTVIACGGNALFGFQCCRGTYSIPI